LLLNIAKIIAFIVFSRESDYDYLVDIFVAVTVAATVTITTNLFKERLM
jgi:hypothetical protein